MQYLFSLVYHLPGVPLLILQEQFGVVRLLSMNGAIPGDSVGYLHSVTGWGYPFFRQAYLLIVHQSVPLFTSSSME